MNPSVITTSTGPLLSRPTSPTITSSMKWWMSILLAFFFFLLAYPGTYYLTNSLWTSLGFTSYLNNGCPTVTAVLIHAILFGLLIRVLLW